MIVSIYLPNGLASSSGAASVSTIVLYCVLRCGVILSASFMVMSIAVLWMRGKRRVPPGKDPLQASVVYPAVLFLSIGPIFSFHGSQITIYKREHNTPHITCRKRRENRYAYRSC